MKLIYSTFLSLTIIAFAASLIASIRSTGYNNNFELREDAGRNKSLFFSAGIILLLLAFGKFLSRYGLLFSQQGIVSGPGWTDVKVRLPMLLLMAVITAAAGIAIMIPSIANNIEFTRYGFHLDKVEENEFTVSNQLGLCDGENYGRFLAYKFPKERRILGTQQVETKIDQDSYLSGQLTL